ncbi:cyclic nucleotide-binding domain-containing protein [Myxococcota bacterium]|nr:cyclic nucleotide-binding domain-containing protein [Myxococcota bacterium]MBU1432916.1 cyclic nucleotide-binding domain-containing protein [Myxococcota bacterium]MBU1899303.1 cyclic nucleotide-binding domain-containing protein [Myxococcota bacterium]
MQQTPAPPRAALEEALIRALLGMRQAPMDFRLRVHAADVLRGLGEHPRAIKILKSCADYFTLAGFPLRALWALKRLEQISPNDPLFLRGVKLLSGNYANVEGRLWGEPIFEMPSTPKPAPPPLPGTPFEDIINEVEERATQRFKGVNFPPQLPPLPLLSQLPPALFEAVVRNLKLKQLRQGEALLREGQVGQSVYIVLNGRAEVYKRNLDDEDIKLADLEEGEVLGEMALVTASPRVATVLAGPWLEVLELSGSILGELGDSAIQLQQALSQQVCGRMIRNLMEISPVFQVIPAADRGALIAHFETRLFNAHEEIIIEGQLGRGLFVILDGLVEVSLKKKGQRHVLNRLREGEIFGEISLLRNTPATATCTAMRRSMLMILSREGFQRLAQRYPRLISKMNELGDFRLLDNIYMLA